MLTQLPHWILDNKNVKPIQWWRYKSCVIDRLFEISTWRDEDKKKYEVELMWFEKFKKRILRNNKHVYWDNKIVIECEIGKSGAKVFIGYFDESWSIGLGRTGDNWIQPTEIK